VAITKYSELDTALDNWLNRTDLTTVIPDFVRLAEARFDREIRHPQMMRRATATADAQYLSLPSDWLEPIRLLLTTTNPITDLQSVTPQQMMAWRSEWSSGGTPKYYSIIGSTLEFLPIPDSSQTVEMLYWERISKLDSTDGESTNWMLTNYPDVYLFGALCEAEPYLVNDDRVPLWESKLDRALTEIRRESESAQIGGGIPRARVRAIGGTGYYPVEPF
jgi:hypothetical protein